MTTAAEKIKANAERLRQTAPAKPAASEGAAPAALDATPVVANQPIVVRQKNVRRTVDLSPAAHRNLDNWQRDAADRDPIIAVASRSIGLEGIDCVTNALCQFFRIDLVIDRYHHNL